MSSMDPTEVTHHTLCGVTIRARAEDRTITVEEFGGRLITLGFEHPNVFGAAETMKILLDRAYLMGAKPPF